MGLARPKLTSPVYVDFKWLYNHQRTSLDL